jgi:hypothetical protein
VPSLELDLDLGPCLVDPVAPRHESVVDRDEDDDEDDDDPDDDEQGGVHVGLPVGDANERPLRPA